MLRINRAKQMRFTNEAIQMLEKKWEQCSCINESEYLELLIRREYQTEHPEEFCEKKEEAARTLLSAISDLQELLSKEPLKYDDAINEQITWFKQDIKKLQKHFKKS